MRWGINTFEKDERLLNVRKSKPPWRFIVILTLRLSIRSGWEIGNLIFFLLQRFNVQRRRNLRSCLRNSFETPVSCQMEDSSVANGPLVLTREQGEALVKAHFKPHANSTVASITEVDNHSYRRVCVFNVDLSNANFR